MSGLGGPDSACRDGNSEASGEKKSEQKILQDESSKLLIRGECCYGSCTLLGRICAKET